VSAQVSVESGAIEDDINIDRNYRANLQEIIAYSMLFPLHDEIALDVTDTILTAGYTDCQNNSVN
jgi:hypothetical protein